MNRLREFFQPRQEYERIDGGFHEEAEDDDDETVLSGTDDGKDAPFSWIEYGVFLLLGAAMLWAWNMFMAAAPYFQGRFRSNPWISNYFQPAEVSASALTALLAMYVLTQKQKNASYPKRILIAFTTSSIAYAILATSTWVQSSAEVYFGFVLVIIIVSSVSTGMIQNGIFAWVTNFGKPQYMQSIMTGQSIAGVLPPLVQIISVSAIKGTEQSGGPQSTQTAKAAFAYFATAVAVSVAAIIAFLYLLRRVSNSKAAHSAAKATAYGASEGEALAEGEVATTEEGSKTYVPLMTLFRKLRFLSLAMFLDFAVSMVFPVFAVQIFSVSGIDPAIFIPLGLLFWNTGDLLGRVISILPQVSMGHYPFALFCIAMARLLYIPLFFLCNIKGRGATVSSDILYLVVVQMSFGLTTGYLGSQCMMAAGRWVLPEERAAAGSFMGLMLIAGLTAGSLLSFSLGNL